jgi:hypothetical protein
VKRILFILPALLCFAFLGNAQNLTISSSGQTGSSGINCIAPGTIPVTTGKLDVLIIPELDNQTTYDLSTGGVTTNCS